MKRGIAAIIFIGTSSLAFHCSSDPAPIFESGSTCNRVVISAHPNYPPFHWLDNDTMTGASIEIAGQIFTEMGLEWEPSYAGPWNRVLHSAVSGDIDFIPALKRTADREEYLNFTETPFYFNPIVFYVKASNTAAAHKELNEFEDLVGTVSRGDNHGKKLDEFISTHNVFEVNGVEKNFQMLDMERSDYFVIGKQTANAYLEKNGLKEKFAIAYELQGFTVVHNAFSKKSPCASLASKFDSLFQEKK